MIFRQRRVRKIPDAIASFGLEDGFVLAIPLAEVKKPKLDSIGFKSPYDVNSCVLPSSQGPVSEFNANGKFIVHKDQPKETAYRLIEWEWEQWAGYNQTETVREMREVPYERYPRTFIPPPSIELTIRLTVEDEKVITVPTISLKKVASDLVVHQINLFLELFGECHVMKEDLTKVVQVPVKRMNWRVLPAGIRTWDQLKDDLKDVIENQPAGNQRALTRRLRHVNSFGPEFAVIGNGGFRDYVVFAFPNKDTYVLESPLMDNATYVFGSDWETLSKLTKSELIAGARVRTRIIHRNSWEDEIEKLLG